MLVDQLQVVGDVIVGQVVGEELLLAAGSGGSTTVEARGAPGTARQAGRPVPWPAQETIEGRLSAGPWGLRGG